MKLHNVIGTGSVPFPAISGRGQSFFLAGMLTFQLARSSSYTNEENQTWTARIPGRSD